MSTFVSIPLTSNSQSQTDHNESQDKSTETFDLEEGNGKTLPGLAKSDEEIKSVTGVSREFLSLLSAMIGSLVPDGRRLSKRDKLILFFMKLKFNLPFLCLSVLFGIDRRTVSTIFNNVLVIF